MTKKIPGELPEVISRGLLESPSGEISEKMYARIAEEITEENQK